LFAEGPPAELGNDEVGGINYGGLSSCLKKIPVIARARFGGSGNGGGEEIQTVEEEIVSLNLFNDYLVLWLVLFPKF